MKNGKQQNFKSLFKTKPFLRTGEKTSVCLEKAGYFACVFVFTGRTPSVSLRYETLKFWNSWLDYLQYKHSLARNLGNGAGVQNGQGKASMGLAAAWTAGEAWQHLGLRDLSDCIVFSWQDLGSGGRGGAGVAYVRSC